MTVDNKRNIKTSKWQPSKSTANKETALKLESSDIGLVYEIIEPEPALSDFVERFYMVMNTSASEKEVVLIPDGRIDLFFILLETGQFIGTLIGIETQPTTASFPPKCIFIGMSLKLLSIEYILHTTIAEILDGARKLPNDFWSISSKDLNNLDSFCKKISKGIREQNKHKIDGRKQKLFNHIYETNGVLKVKEYAQYVFWSERQINRYFNQTFGLSLKAFCNILRFKASFQHIKEGNLFPVQNFADQAHFIRDVKRYTKVTPKRLAKNKNDRFIQFSTLPSK